MKKVGSGARAAGAVDTLAALDGGSARVSVAGGQCAPDGADAPAGAAGATVYRADAANVAGDSTSTQANNVCGYGMVSAQTHDYG